MPSIRKILFPVDFSPACVGAARYVEAVAGHFEAEIMLLCAVGMGEHALAEELLPLKQASLDAFLADELKYFTTQRLCVTGDAVPEIIAAAQRWNPDIVMMPTHGLGVFRRLLLGSVTTEVLHDLDCPVWTSVHSEAAPSLEDIHCRRILCAVDLTERSGSVLEWAAWLAGEYDAELGIVHATPSWDGAYLGGALEDELTQSASHAAKEQIGNLRAAAGITGPVFVVSGDPAKVVGATATNFDADLLVMGRHNGEGISGYPGQSASAILSDSPCPVISV